METRTSLQAQAVLQGVLQGVLRTAPRMRFVGLGTAMLCGMLLSSCQDSQRRDVGATPSSRAIAVVNNEPIAVEAFLNAHLRFFTRWDHFIRNDSEKKKDLKEIILAKMIDEKLIDQEARRRNIKTDEGELDQEIRKLVGPYDDEDLLRNIQRPALTMAQWRETLRRRLVHQHLIQQEVIKKIRMSQRELKAYYQRNRAAFVIPEQVRVRHIAVNSRSQLQKIARELRRGESFVSLVERFSITPDREKKGDLGFVQRNVLPKAFDSVIFKMSRIGAISSMENPVKTQMGFHVFRLEGRKPQANRSFRQALPLVKKELLEQKQTRAYQVWLQTLRDKATIRIDKDLLKAEMG